MLKNERREGSELKSKASSEIMEISIAPGA